MRRCIPLYSFVLALVLALGLSVTASAAEIPTITAQGVLDLVKENKGKVVLVNVFATWCPPCREELPELKKIRAAYPESKVTIVSISVDENKSKLKAFVGNMDFNYPVYLADDSVPETFQISAIPFNMIFDQNGTMLDTAEGMISEEEIVEMFDALLK